MSGETIFLGRADEAVALRLDRANRHGVVAGATGTGKTVTLQGWPRHTPPPLPVFAADEKGDLAGVACPCAGREDARPRPDHGPHVGAPARRR
jgi:hypothetical protein